MEYVVTQKGEVKWSPKKTEGQNSVAEIEVMAFIDTYKNIRSIIKSPYFDYFLFRLSELKTLDLMLYKSIIKMMNDRQYKDIALLMFHLNKYESDIKNGW